MQLNILLNGIESVIVVSPSQIADLVRLAQVIPAIPALSVFPPNPSPGESTAVGFSIAPCAAAARFRVEAEDPAGDWETKWEDVAQPGNTIGSTLYFPESQKAFKIRAIAIGSTGEQREGDPVSVSI